MTDPLLGSVLRLRYKAKKIANPRVRNPFRHRKKGVKLTQEERKAKQVIRNANKERLTAALQAARKVVMAEAEKLAAEFPGHDKEYYYRMLMQQSSRNKGKRAINEWQAFVSQEVKKHNEGT